MSRYRLYVNHTHDGNRQPHTHEGTNTSLLWILLRTLIQVIRLLVDVYHVLVDFHWSGVEMWTNGSRSSFRGYFGDSLDKRGKRDGGERRSEWEWWGVRVVTEKGDGVNHQYHCSGELLSSVFALLGSGSEQEWIGYWGILLYLGIHTTNCVVTWLYRERCACFRKLKNWTKAVNWLRNSLIVLLPMNNGLYSCCNERRRRTSMQDDADCSHLSFYLIVLLHVKYARKNRP